MPVLSPPEVEATPSVGGCDCESHKMLRGAPNKLKFGVVHQYAYKPAWRKRAVPNDPHSYYLGVELETVNASYATNNGMAADMRLPKTLWTAKTDASVSGPEFVSQPATLAYWKRQEPDLREMFKLLLHAGFRSHEGDRAGMHINVDRDAFADERHLMRFLKFLYRTPSWSRAVAQRTKNSSERWSKVDVPRLRSARGRKAYCDEVRPQPVRAWRLDDRGNYGYTPTGRTMNGGSSDRYLALNAPAGEGRFEFRLPRGTLRVDRFFKNLEWLVSMIEFTRLPNKECRRHYQYYAYLRANARTYPNLVAFLEERVPNFNG